MQFTRMRQKFSSPHVLTSTIICKFMMYCDYLAINQLWFIKKIVNPDLISLQISYKNIGTRILINITHYC